MATRRLSRTIIEGGKTSYDKSDRKEQINKSRRKARDFCTTYIDEDSIEPPNYEGCHYYRAYNDRIASLRRYLRSHIGLPWDVVYSKLCRMESRKTTRGWHFLDHAIRSVRTSMGLRDLASTYWGLYLDDSGILQQVPWKAHRQPYNRKLLKRYENWIGEGRRIRLVGLKYFWFVITEESKSRMLYYRTSSGNAIFPFSWSWRQHIPLTRKEIGHMEWLKAKDDRIWKKILKGA